MNYYRPAETDSASQPPMTVNLVNPECAVTPHEQQSIPTLPFGVIITSTDPEFTSWSTQPSQPEALRDTEPSGGFPYTVSTGNFVPDPFEELKDAHGQIAGQHQHILALQEQLHAQENVSNSTTKKLRAEIARLTDIAITAMYKADAAMVWVKILDQTNRQLDYNARTDDLTQLGNRTDLYNDYRQHNNWSFGFLLDVDYFKAVNDLFGHPLGDRVLIEISKQTRRSIRDEDTDILARIGGDEFMGVVANTGPSPALPGGTGDQMDKISARIAENTKTGLDKLLGTVLREPEFKSDTNKSLLLMAVFSRLGVSVGTVPYMRGMDFNDLYKQADDKMYKLKKSRHAAQKNDAVCQIIEKALAAEPGAN